MNTFIEESRKAMSTWTTSVLDMQAKGYAFQKNQWELARKSWETSYDMMVKSAELGQSMVQDMGKAVVDATEVKAEA